MSKIFPLRIAFIVNSFPTISQTFILDQITGILDRGHIIDIFSLNIEKNKRVHDDVIKYNLLKHTYYFPRFQRNKFIRLISLPQHIIKFFPKHYSALINALNIFRFGKKASSLYLLYRSVPFLKNNSYDIIHCHFGPNGNLAVSLKKIGIFKGKIITTFYGYDLTSYVKKNGPEIYKNLFEKGDLILSISKNFKKRLVNLGCNDKKIDIHHLGINSDKFKFYQRTPIKAQNKICILSISRLVEKKGIIYGIKAVKKLLIEFTNIEYLIAGDGPLKQELNEFIKKFQLKNNVKLLGEKKQDEILNLMKAATIFLAPSVKSKSGDEEGTPVAIMEALASGIPVVSTCHSGIPELVMHGKTGLLANECDSDDLANKIREIILNPLKSKKMVLKGRKHIEQNYDINILNNKLIDTYYRVLMNYKA